MVTNRAGANLELVLTFWSSLVEVAGDGANEEDWE